MLRAQSHHYLSKGYRTPTSLRKSTIRQTRHYQGPDYNVKQQSKKESYHWYKAMREGEYEYIHECKALRSGTVINLSDSQFQIKALIDAASQTAATRDPKSPTPSSIHFVTTAGVVISPEVVAYATARDVLITRHVAEEVISDGNIVGIRIGAENFLIKSW